MKKRYIVQDSLNKYYNKCHDSYWTTEFNDAWLFNSEEDVVSEFHMLNIVDKLDSAALPLQILTFLF